MRLTRAVFDWIIIEINGRVTRLPDFATENNFLGSFAWVRIKTHFHNLFILAFWNLCYAIVGLSCIAYMQFLASMGTKILQTMTSFEIMKAYYWSFFSLISINISFFFFPKGFIVVVWLGSEYATALRKFTCSRGGVGYTS